MFDTICSVGCQCIGQYWRRLYDGRLVDIVPNRQTSRAIRAASWLNSNKGTKCEIGIEKSKRLSLDGFNPARFQFIPASAGPKTQHSSAHSCKMCSFQNAASMISKDEKLQDTVGIKPQKLTNQRDTVLGVAKTAQLQGRNGLR